MSEEVLWFIAFCLFLLAVISVVRYFRSDESIRTKEEADKDEQDYGF